MQDKKIEDVLRVFYLRIPRAIEQVIDTEVVKVRKLKSVVDRQSKRSETKEGSMWRSFIDMLLRM